MIHINQLVNGSGETYLTQAENRTTKAIDTFKLEFPWMNKPDSMLSKIKAKARK